MIAWPPTHWNIGDNTIVLNYVERYYLQAPTRKCKKWRITFVFNSGNECYLTYDTEDAARAGLQQLREAYDSKPDWSQLFKPKS